MAPRAARDPIAHDACAGDRDGAPPGRRVPDARRRTSSSAIVVIVRPGERMPVDGVVAAGRVRRRSGAGDRRVLAGREGAGRRRVRRHDQRHGRARDDGDARWRPTARSRASSISSRTRRASAPRCRRSSIVSRAGTRRPSWCSRLPWRSVPPLVVGGLGGWSAAFPTWSYRALALLVVACPCALVISTPVSIVSALTAAARAGVLDQGRRAPRAARRRPCRRVRQDRDADATRRSRSPTSSASTAHSTHGVLSVAAALEARSEHPIGRAIVHRALAAGLDVAPGERFRALPGLGAEATVAAATGHRRQPSAVRRAAALHAVAARARRGSRGARRHGRARQLAAARRSASSR